MKKLFKFLPALLAVISLLASAQTFASSTDINPGFDTKFPLGFNQPVTAMAMQSDGKVVVYGNFSTYQGSPVGNLVRLNVDGTRDLSLNIGNGFEGTPSVVAVQSDGKIIVGGYFTKYQGVSASNLIRLNTNGTRDTNFVMGAGIDPNGMVTSITIQSNGKVLVGGYFTSYNGVAANSFVRLNADGSLDNTFSAGNGFDNTPLSIAVQSDEKIIVGGFFTTYQGSSAKGIIRLNSDGSKDSNFVIGAGFDSYVSSIAVQGDGKIIAGGAFTTYQSAAAGGIIRLNSDGSKDTNFAIGTAFNGEVKSIGIETGGKIIAGGAFTTYQGTAAGGIIRLNSDGSKDSSFENTPGLYNSFSPSIAVLAIQPNGQIIAVGQFTRYNGVGARNIVRINTNGTRDNSGYLGNGLDAAPNIIKILSGGKLLVNGDFSIYGGVVNNGLIVLNTNGSLDTSFAGAYSGRAIAVQSDGKIIVGGYFTKKIARLNIDGTVDSSFVVGSGFNSYISALAIQSDGKIVVAGPFTNYNGTTANKLTRLNTDGSIDGTFSAGTSVSGPVYMGNGTIETVKIQSDGKILIGGYFTTYNGAGANGIARLNTGGTLDGTFSVGATIDQAIAHIAIQSGGKIIIGGGFTKKIYRLNTNGSVDNTFLVGNGFDGAPSSIAIQSDDKILITTYGTDYNGTSIRYKGLVRLSADGVLDSTFNTDSGIGGASTLALGNDGTVFVGGGFTTYKSAVAGYLVALYGDTPVVVLPNSSDANTVNNAFTTQGYTETNGTLMGSTPISLSGTDGNIPTTLDITNQNLNISLPGNTQIKQPDTTTNYSGIISVPVTKYIASVNDQTVISAFNVGSNSSPILLAGGSAKLSIPVPGQTIGDMVNVYYSQDNGVTWTFETTAQVIDKNGDPYVEFTTNHFGDFAITQLPPDTIAPTATVSFDISSATNHDVIATITGFSEVITGLNTTTHTFTANDSFVFTFEDRAGNTGSVTATVTWIDKEVPVITIVGNPSINITQGDTYSDAGATALDNINGDLTSSIVTSGSVNTSITGTYVIRYNVVDAVGNSATEVTRYVTVAAKGAPTATINYNITGTTDQDVIATITGFSEAITGLNATTHTFTANGTFVFTFQDIYGNPGSITATVTWIKKPTSGGGGNSSSSLANDLIDSANKLIPSIVNSPYPKELNDAYLWAFANNITTQPTIQRANMEGVLIRKDMAKMITNFAVNVLKKDISTGTNCTFADTKLLSTEAQTYAIAACKLGIMGYENDGVTVKKNFNPDVQVDRAQFGTILSRVLRGNKYNGGSKDIYFRKHLDALKSVNIMNKIGTPLQKEIRGYVMLMMMRSASK